MTKSTVLYDSATDSSPTAGVRLDRGIRYIEVVGAMSTDTVQIQLTLDDAGTDWKTDSELSFSEGTKKLEVVRGGINARVVHTGSETTFKVITELASE